MYKLKPYILVLPLLLFTLILKSQPYDELLNKNGIRVVELEKHHDKNHIRTIFYVDARLENAVSTILKTREYTRWVSNIKKLYPIYKPNDTLLYCRAVVGVRSVFKKEGIVRTTLDRKENKAVIQLKLVPDYNYDYTYDKLNSFNARWTITPQSNKKVKVELTYLGGRDNYPEFVNRLLDKILTKKLYRLSYGIKKEVEGIA